MRITDGIMMNNFRLNINRNLAGLTSLQENLSSGKRINKPSDDPVGIINSLRYRTNIVEAEEYINKIGSAKSFMETTDSALDKVTSIIHRAKELLVKAANGTNTTESRAAIAEEIDQIKDQLGVIANTTFGSKHIFSGTNVTNQPYDVANDKWIGNDSSIALEIGVGVEIPINSAMGDFFCTRPIQGSAVDLGTIAPTGTNFKIRVDGTEYTVTPGTWGGGTSDQFKTFIQTAIDTAEDAGSNALGPNKVVFGGNATDGYTLIGEPKITEVSLIAGDGSWGATIMGGTPPAIPARSTTNLGIIQLFDKIANAVHTEDQDGMQDGLGELEIKLDALLLERARIGAKTNRLDMQQLRLESTHTNYTSLLSLNEDADMAQVIMDLKVRENVYRASLAAGARIIQPTLIDFLR